MTIMADLPLNPELQEMKIVKWNDTHGDIIF